MEWLRELFSSNLFMPHGHCYLWRPAVLWTQVLTNLFIGLAYLSITLTLTTLVVRVRDIPFRWMYAAFGIFIVTCGFTHFMDVVVIWRPMYWADGALRAVTAVASVATAILLPPLVPKAVALAQGAKAANDRGIKLESAVRDLETMYQRSRDTEELKTRFFANVSHELRTPLTLILGPVERMLAVSELADGDRARLELVSRNARTLLRLVDDLLDVARLEAGKLTARYAEVDVGAMVQSVAAAFRSHAEDGRLTLTADAPPTIAEVDASKLERAIVNLVANALRFTPAGGVVRLQLRATDDELRIDVCDSGPGVRDDQRELIFERFRQADDGQTIVGGSGLGLAIAREVTRLQRGDVTVGDAPEGGACFTVTLPRRAPAGAAVARGVAGPMAAGAVDVVADTHPVATGTGDASILVVEDHADLRHFVAEALGDDARVLTAADGEEALALALEHRPDVIVTDVMMPRMSGDQLLVELRTHAELEHVPVIVLTARHDERMRVQMLRAGARDYVTKPFSAEELRARVINQLAIKRTGDVLRAQLHSTATDVAGLAGELATRNRDLEVAIEELRRARDTATRAADAQAWLVRAMSHELKIPMTIVVLQLALLERQRDPLSERQKTIVDRLRKATARLSTLVDSMLDLVRAESGRLIATATAGDLTAIAQDVLDDYEPRAASKPLRLELVAPGKAALTTDARLVRIALSNLVDNAIKYTSAGSVVVAVEPVDDGWRLSVTDTGPGIPDGDRERVFRPFEQLERDRDVHQYSPGLGIGLPLVKQIVDALGGALTLETATGGGAAFHVTLPRELR